jgi:hypothetical protein
MITWDDIKVQMKKCREDGTQTFGNREATFCNYAGEHPYWCVADNMLHPEDCPRLREQGEQE